MIGVILALLVIGGFVVIGTRPTSTRLSPLQIAAVARNAGFSGADLVTAVAIALAESGGSPTQYNPESAYFQRHGISAEDAQGHGSYGLWQIFSYQHPEYSPEQLKDPQTNANEAFKVYSDAGNSFRPWSTFTQGPAGANDPNKFYIAHVPSAEQGVSA